MVWKKLVPIAVICALGLVAGSVAQGSGGTKHHHKHHHARLPAKFFGINPNSGTPTPAQYARMRRGGIRTFRTPVYWRGINYLPGVYNWSSVDHVMRLAPKAGLDVLPFIVLHPLLGQPRRRAAMPVGSPAQERAWTTFLAALVARYGPHGTFWKLNPDGPLLTGPLLADLERDEPGLVHQADLAGRLCADAEDLPPDPEQGRSGGEDSDRRPLRRALPAEAPRGHERHRLHEAALQGQGGQVRLRCLRPAPLRGHCEGDEEADRQHPRR